MRKTTLAHFAALLLAMVPTALHAADPEDPYLWLEDVSGDKALDWVRAQNEKGAKVIEADPAFQPMFAKFQEILNSRDRIPFATKLGPWYYNFWRDEKNTRGLWRRTTLEEFRKPAPAWETVIDLDQLAAKEKENWVWKGAECRYPKYRRCMLNLSRGGGDAIVIREFDVVAKDFVKDGFALPEAKSQVAWRDDDTLYVGTDFGAGSLTDSGYPRIVKEWKRGTPLAQAKMVFEGQKTDVAAGAEVFERRGFPRREIMQRSPTFFTTESWLRGEQGLARLEVPADARLSIFRDHLMLRLRSAWEIGGKRFVQGALVAIDLKRFLEGKRDFQVLFEPTDRSSLQSYSGTRDYLLLNVLDNVRPRVFEVSAQGEAWKRREIALPVEGTVSVGAVDEDDAGDGSGAAGTAGNLYWLTGADYLTPSTLFLGTAGKDGQEKLKSLPAFFDAAPYKVAQYEATSRDGTKVPYFVVMRKEAKFDGSNPTILYGYGGFEIPELPVYSPRIAHGWLQFGGLWVSANIRGGGEFGPRWHQAALKEKRQNAYDDFIAVAEDLAARKITSKRHLGIYGGSNGGLLVGAVMVERPDLFQAVTCAVPLLDMKRFNHLLAGASWMAEYGNPDDPRDWAYISKYSPYQNVKAGVRYPDVFFETSTRDDRVHPGHARKMAARMLEQGHTVKYYENIEGGHSIAANNRQQAYMSALMYTFFLEELR